MSDHFSGNHFSPATPCSSLSKMIYRMVWTNAVLLRRSLQKHLISVGSDENGRHHRRRRRCHRRRTNHDSSFILVAFFHCHFPFLPRALRPNHTWNLNRIGAKTHVCFYCNAKVHRIVFAVRTLPALAAEWKITISILAPSSSTSSSRCHTRFVSFFFLLVLSPDDEWEMQKKYNNSRWLFFEASAQTFTIKVIGFDGCCCSPQKKQKCIRAMWELPCHY